MYMNVHSMAGAGIALSTYSLVPEALLAAAPMAVISHCILDLIGEPKWTKGESLLFDGAFMAAFGALLLSVDPTLALVMIFGWFFGNLPDIMDSNFYLTYVNKDRWPNRKRWFCHYEGYELVRPSGHLTVAISAGIYVAAFLTVKGMF